MNVSRQLHELQNKVRANEEVIAKMNALNEEKGSNACNLLLQMAKLHNKRIRSAINLIAFETDNLNTLIDNILEKIVEKGK